MQTYMRANTSYIFQAKRNYSRNWQLGLKSKRGD